MITASGENKTRGILRHRNSSDPHKPKPKLSVKLKDFHQGANDDELCFYTRRNELTDRISLKPKEIKNDKTPGTPERINPKLIPDKGDLGDSEKLLFLNSDKKIFEEE